MLLFIKALLIFLLIKQHYTTHSSNLMEHTWTKTGKRETAGREVEGCEIRVCRSGLTCGGTEPLGGTVALHGTAWHYANLQWNAREDKTGMKPMLEFLVKYSHLMMQRLNRGRLIMAVVDPSDKIYPEERVELQR